MMTTRTFVLSWSGEASSKKGAQQKEKAPSRVVFSGSFRLSCLSRDRKDLKEYSTSPTCVTTNKKFDNDNATGKPVKRMG